jgi:hypothetical protein
VDMRDKNPILVTVAVKWSSPNPRRAALFL